MILRSRTARVLAAAGGTLLIASGLAGCAQVEDLVRGGGAERDAETSEVTESGTESVFDIEVGDCLKEPEGTGQQVTDVEVIPCSDEHDYEVYYAYSVDDLGEEWPGEEAITADGDAKCNEQFASFVGVPFDQSASLWYTYYTPTQQSWSGGDTLVQCLVYEASDQNGMELTPVTGSLEGANR